MEKQTGQKNKITLEYELSSQSIPMIWDAIATAPGLASWFADSVQATGRSFSFSWGKNETRQAELINCRQFTYVRFHWTDDDPGTFFELRIQKNDLTHRCHLEVTDFAEPGSGEDIRSLWDSSIDALRRCGL